MKTPDLPEGKSSAPSKRNFTTDNPRHLRAIHALDTRPMPREHLDSAAGCSNSPELVAELRRRGLEIPCQDEAAQQTNLNQNSNRPDALLQWHALAANVKNSRTNHQPKREWKRGRK